MKNSIVKKVQLITTFAAAVLIAIFAFFPVLSVRVESGDSVYNAFDGMIEKAMNEELEALDKKLENEEVSLTEYYDEMEEIYERYGELALYLMGIDEEGDEVGDTYVSVSGIKFLTRIPKLISLLKYYFVGVGEDTISGATGGTVEADLTEASDDDVDPDAVTKENIDMFRVFFGGFISALNFENLSADIEDSGFSVIFKLIGVLMLTLIKLGILISAIVVFPIMTLITAIKLALSMISSENRGKHVFKKCSTIIIRLAVILTAVVICGAKFTGFGVVILVMAALAVAVNLAASRLKKCTSNQFKYLNIMQPAAVVAIVGAIIFAISFAKANLISFYTSGDVMMQVETAALESADDAESALISAAIGMAVLAIMGSVTVGVLRSVFKTTMKCALHGACMRKGGENAGYMIGISGIAIFVVNKIVMGIYDVTLPSAQSSSMTVALVGAIIALAAGIASTVLRSVFVPDMTAVEMAAVTTGSYAASDDDEAEDEAEASSDEE